MSDDRSTFKGAAVTTGSTPPKPRRPLTIFNLFSILERNFIVQQNQKRASAPSNAPEDTKATVDHYLSTRPEKYREVVLPSNWYVVGMNRVKRSKHKVHGVISFNELTKELSNGWKSLDANTKQYCEMIAADELERYRMDMAAYDAMYGKDAVKSQKQTRETHSKTILVENNDRVTSDDIPECTNAIGLVTGLAVDVATRVRGIYFTRPFEIRISFSPHRTISPHPLSHL